MDSKERSDLMWTNWQRREALAVDLEKRKMNPPLDATEWSPRPMTPAPAPEPAPPRIAPTSQFMTREAVVAMFESYSELVGEHTGKVERDLRGVIDQLLNRVGDLETRVDQLEAEQSRGWFGKRKA